MNPIKQQLNLVYSRIRRLNYHHYLPDLVIISFSLYASLYLRLGTSQFKAFAPTLNRYFLLFLALRFGTFICTGVYDIIWRYVSLDDATRLIKAVFLSSLLILAATYLVDIGHLPRATFVIDLFLVTSMLGGIRFLRRLAHQGSFEREVNLNGRMSLIYGAGTNGRTLASRFHLDSDLGLKLLGFIDDDPQKVGRIISGVKVLGTRRELPDLLRDYQIQEVIVALAQPPGSLLRELVEICQPFHIRPRLISGTAGSQNLPLVREVELSDLLARPRRDMDVASIRDLIHGRRVLVTGAGGSIGSELARQVFGFGPSLLLLLDHSEYNLYQIDQQLRGSQGDNGLVVPLLVDIKDRQVLENVFKEYLPEIVFHAAAYKHVHLVESNPFPAILNNVDGTKNLLELCESSGVETFVLISTDKAVNPAGVMGATKRVCELMTTQVGQRTGKRYCAVRFGNVLGSSGSLIPFLKEQIDKGQPVTITHQDMARYFMLISEAVSLVLRAATIAQAGDITILRMGEPIKIVDIAKNLIALMGKTEDQIPLVFTGVRPGEKIFEELYLCGNELITEDPDILVLPRGDQAIGNSMDGLGFEINRILERARGASKEAVFRLGALAKGKNPEEMASGEEGWEEPFNPSKNFVPLTRRGLDFDH